MQIELVRKLTTPALRRARRWICLSALCWTIAATACAVEIAGVNLGERWELLYGLILSGGIAFGVIASVVSIKAPLEQMAALCYRSGYVDAIKDVKHGVHRESDVIEMPLVGGPTA